MKFIIRSVKISLKYILNTENTSHHTILDIYSMFYLVWFILQITVRHFYPVSFLRVLSYRLNHLYYNLGDK